MPQRARTHRRRTRVATIVLAAVLVIGVTAARGSHRTVTRSEAGAVANAISVRESDVPSLNEQSNPITTQERELSSQLTRCIGGVPESRAYADTQSPSFENSGSSSLTVSSSTEILPTAALVAKDFAAVTGPKGLPCLEGQIRGQLDSSVPQGEMLHISAARLPAVVSGSDGAFTFRFTVLITAQQGGGTVNVPLYYDVIGLAYGQAEIGLDVLTTHAKPSASLERRLAARLLARARTAIG